MTGGVTSGAAHVDVYVRSLRTHRESTQREILEEVRALCERAAVESFDVVVWGDCAPATPADARTDTGESISNRVRVFREWGRRNEVALDPALRRRAVESSVRGESYDEVRLPAVLVAVYGDEGLRCVAPHRDGSGVYTATDCLTDLATADDEREYVPLERSEVETDDDGEGVGGIEPPRTVAAGSRTCATERRSATDRRRSSDRQHPGDGAQRADRSTAGPLPDGDDPTDAAGDDGTAGDSIAGNRPPDDGVPTDGVSADDDDVAGADGVSADDGTHEDGPNEDEGDSDRPGTVRRGFPPS